MEKCAALTFVVCCKGYAVASNAIVTTTNCVNILRFPHVTSFGCRTKNVNGLPKSAAPRDLLNGNGEVMPAFLLFRCTGAQELTVRPTRGMDSMDLIPAPLLESHNSRRRVMK